VSRAFVKEDDQDRASSELPERPLSPHPNYVTPRGLAALEREFGELTQQRAALPGLDAEMKADEARRQIDRNLRYLKARIEGAILIDPAAQPRDEVAFGATVRVCDSDDRERIFTIVGEDEADVAAGRVSWVSPLARALLGAEAFDRVVWKRPSGDCDLEIVAIAYESPESV
jgi:transcription elongation GreA/GreB family factor